MWVFKSTEQFLGKDKVAVNSIFNICSNTWFSKVIFKNCIYAFRMVCVSSTIGFIELRFLGRLV